MFQKKNSFNNETLKEHEIKQLKQYILEMEQEPKIYDELSEE
jgi:cAMP-dependent protein kinase regulator